MSLFRTKDLAVAKIAQKSKAIGHKGDQYAVIGKKNQKVGEVLWMGKQGDMISFVSHGDWSTHDILFYYLTHLKVPARVAFTTWSISEFAIRQLYNYVEQGLITKLSGLFDYRNGIHKPAEVQFLQKITSDVQPAKCHAKVCIITTDQWGISIVTSGNFTRNPRIECGTITFNKDIARFHESWIMNELNNTSCFD
jgi:hypothetical protein